MNFKASSSSSPDHSLQQPIHQSFHLTQHERSTTHEDSQYIMIWGSFPSSTYPLTCWHFPFAQKIISVSAGNNFCVFLTICGNVYGSGSNDHHQLAPSDEPLFEFTQISIESQRILEKITCGTTHVIAWNSDQLYGWGQSTYGATGYIVENPKAKQVPRKIPFLVPYGDKIEEVSCGNNTSVIQVGDDFYGLGDNRKGQLGFILKTYSAEPEIIRVFDRKRRILKNIKRVKCGDEFTVAVDSEGKFYGAGHLDCLGFRSGKIHLHEGLFPLEKVNNENEGKILDYECKKELYVHDNEILKIYGNFMGRNFRSISLPHGENLSLSIGKNYGYAYDTEKVYSWGYSQELIFRSGKQIFSKTPIILNGNNIRLLCCDSFGIGVMNEGCCLSFEHFYNQNFSQSKPQKSFEDQWDIVKKRQRSEIVEEVLSNTQRICSLQKENKEQKQIINMFIEYVEKLEGENAKLKNKINILPLDDDFVPSKLQQLKGIIKDVISKKI